MEQKVRREIIAWFWVGLVFLLINGAIGQARVIPSGSMEDTLLIGDHLIMSRVGYDAGIPFTGWHVPLWRNPKRQQIIIFKPPFDLSQPDYVKRAIGLPGDIIDIDIPKRGINVRLSDQELARRREAMDAKGKDAWKPAKRERHVSPALRAYAALTTSASKGAVRDVSQVERKS